MIITKPTLLLDKQKCLRNIQKMVKKARLSEIAFRPHFKTHQSIEIGNWFRDFGVHSITVSSVDMAMYFASAGWRDITIAFSINILEIKNINYLSEFITLNILVENIEAVQFLKKSLSNQVGVFIKLDMGYKRTGIDANNISKINEVIDEINKSNNLLFKGFLIHSGNTYNAKNISEIVAIHNKVIEVSKILKKIFQIQFPDLIISVGDTPSCSIVDNYEGIDEIRPGNFVYYDLMQYFLGSCSLDEIAVAMACPVVAKHEERNEIIIYGGAIHFSKDHIINENPEKIFGLAVNLKEDGWEFPAKINYLSKVSQEHGTLKVTKEYFKQIKIGDMIGILPVHSCLTANLMKEIYCFDGEINNSIQIYMR